MDKHRAGPGFGSTREIIYTAEAAAPLLILPCARIPTPVQTYQARSFSEDIFKFSSPPVFSLDEAVPLPQTAWKAATVGGGRGWEGGREMCL